MLYSEVDIHIVCVSLSINIIFRFIKLPQVD